MRVCVSMTRYGPAWRITDRQEMPWNWPTPVTRERVYYLDNKES